MQIIRNKYVLKFNCQAFLLYFFVVAVQAGGFFGDGKPEFF
jgi:hypothetical protein